MNDITLIGLSHKTAPVELRERCRLEDAAGALGELKELADESALLSTCNRFEVYAHGLRDPGAVLAWIGRQAAVDLTELEPRCYVRRGRNAAKHLFFVAASLDSLVVGETQIRKQVKDAYQAAHEAGSVGGMLHRLFQAALRVSKEIADATGVGRGNVSVAGAAADLAERVFGDLATAAVMVIGAGDTAELVLSHLVSRGVERFSLLNRTAEHAAALADRFGGSAAGLDAIDEHLPLADIVVCAAGGETPIIGLESVRRALRRRRGRPVVVIDIAVPRGADAALDQLDNVYRYDMDALTAVTQDALRHRRQDFLQCCTMIDAATLRLDAETRAQRAGRAIAELERTYLEAADGELSELERKLGGLPEADRRQVRRAVHRLVRKLLHLPVRAMRRGDPEESEAIRRVFLDRKDP